MQKAQDKNGHFFDSHQFEVIGKNKKKDLHSLYNYTEYSIT